MSDTSDATNVSSQMQPSVSPQQQQQQCGNNSTSNNASSTGTASASVPLVFRSGCPPEGAGAQLLGPPLPGAQTQLQSGAASSSAHPSQQQQQQPSQQQQPPHLQSAAGPPYSQLPHAAGYPHHHQQHHHRGGGHHQHYHPNQHHGQHHPHHHQQHHHYPGGGGGGGGGVSKRGGRRGAGQHHYQRQFNSGGQSYGGGGGHRGLGGQHSGSRQPQQQFGGGGSGGGGSASSQFAAHLTPEEVSAGLTTGELISGQVRISQRNFEESFVSHPNGDSDIVIPSLIDRNRALNDDEVAVRIKPVANWRVVGMDSSSASGGLDIESTPSKFSQQQQSPTVESVLATGQATFADLFPGVVVPGDSQSDDATREEAIAAMLKSNADPCQPLPVDKVQRIGQVVAIVRQLANRRFVGYAKPGNGPNQPLVLFAPLDSRQPRCLVPRTDLPPMFASRPGDFERTLFVAELVSDWRPECRMPQVRICRQLGSRAAGHIDLELETRVILEHHSIDAEEFEPDALAEVAEASSGIDSDELSRRRDFRDPNCYCVFTVDPETARDLDDAVHFRELADGSGDIEVGVHIADVSHFVRPGTKVDAAARNRATTTYLVQRAYPMLPRRLCEQLCSLNPREDKLAFSVVWRIDSISGDVKSTWFGKSVIRSCCQLSYQHAQHFIEGHSDMQEPPLADLSGDAEIIDADKKPAAADAANGSLMPDLRRASARVEAPHTVQSVADSVRSLHNLATKLRRRRFADGALRIDQPRLTFRLADALPSSSTDDNTAAPPMAFSVYELRESNRMIEEFMLLANCSVAHKLRDSQPELAFLRRHMPPSERALQALKKTSTALRVQLDVGSSGTLQASLGQASQHLDSEQHLCLLSLCAKQMQLAKYFCIGSAKDPELWRHYALNVPLYTHFTSPIRRYADVVVHRQLCAALCNDAGVDADESVAQSVETVESLTGQAQVCNKKKKDAKEAGERSIDLYYAAFVVDNGPLDEVAVVIGVLDKAVDILLTRCGLVRRLYMDQQAPMLRRSHEFRAGAVQGCGQLSLHFNGCHSAKHQLTLCPMSTIDVSVSSCMSKDDPMKLKLLLKPPACELCDDPSGNDCLK